MSAFRPVRIKDEDFDINTLPVEDGNFILDLPNNIAYLDYGNRRYSLFVIPPESDGQIYSVQNNAFVDITDAVTIVEVD